MEDENIAETPHFVRFNTFENYAQLKNLPPKCTERAYRALVRTLTLQKYHLHKDSKRLGVNPDRVIDPASLAFTGYTNPTELRELQIFFWYTFSPLLFHCLPRLERLEMGRMSEKTTSLRMLRDLKALVILHGKSPDRDLGFLTGLYQLEELSITHLKGVETLGGILTSTGLRRLEISDQEELKDVEAIRDFPHLEHLQISGANGINFFAFEGALGARKIRRLNIHTSEKTALFASAMQGAQHLTSLTHLGIAFRSHGYDNRPVFDLSFLTHLPHLRFLRLNGAFDNVTVNQPTQPAAPNFAWLQLAGFDLQTVQKFSKTPVRSIFIADTEIPSIDLLKGFAQVEQLYLVRTKTHDFSALRDWPNLKKIYLHLSDEEEAEFKKAHEGFTDLKRMYVDDPDFIRPFWKPTKIEQILESRSLH